jgi:hypothetical protein
MWMPRGHPYRGPLDGNRRADAGLHHHGNSGADHSGADHEVAVPPQSTISLSSLSTTVRMPRAPKTRRQREIRLAKRGFAAADHINRDVPRLLLQSRRTAKIGELLPPWLPGHHLARKMHDWALFCTSMRRARARSTGRVGSDSLCNSFGVYLLGAPGLFAPRLKVRRASGRTRRRGTALPPDSWSAVGYGCARCVRSRAHRS